MDGSMVSSPLAPSVHPCSSPLSPSYPSSPSFPSSCLPAGFVERAGAAKWSEAAAVPSSSFASSSSVAGYHPGCILEGFRNNCAFRFWLLRFFDDFVMIMGAHCDSFLVLDIFYFFWARCQVTFGLIFEW